MFLRLLIAIILIASGSQFAAAGVITSADSFEFKSSSNTMSVPDHQEDQDIAFDAGQDAGMSKGIASNSTLPTPAVVEYSEFDFNVLPTEVGSRWRLRNQTLPNSPFSQGLLKPS